jgi:hypothetical protein
MKWKSIKKHKPTCNIMGKSEYDLLMFDGENYHRGWASYNKTDNSNDASLKNPRYYSIDAKAYINPLRFLEIKSARKSESGNVWGKQYRIY